MEEAKPVPRYGFIGLGVMGWGMANSILSKAPQSSSLTVCEISKDRLNQFIAQAPRPVSIATCPRDVVENSDVIITMLPKGPHVWDVFTNPSTGLLSAPLSSLQSKLFLECSTIDIQTSKSIAAMVSKASADFVDAPVSGGVHGATTGTLSFMLGCRANVFEHAKDVLLYMGKEGKIFHCGEVGAGLATKQINNYLSCVTMVGTCEAMNMGIRCGLDPAKLAGVINVSTGACYNSSDQNPVKGVSEISSAARDFEGGFTTEMCKGVLDMAVEYGRSVGAGFVVADVILEFYESAAANEECVGKDFRSIWKLSRRMMRACNRYRVS